MQNSRQPGEWQMQLAESGRRGRRDRDDFFFGHRFHRRFFGGNEFGFFGYPLYGYGLGLFSDCPDWLVPDWEWQEYYNSECEGYSEPQDNLIVGYGADQSYSADQGYGAAQADTQQIYGSYAEQNTSAPVTGPGGSPGTGNVNKLAAADDANAPQHPDTLVYLADGTNCAVTTYWLAGGDLHYVTSYGAGDSVPVGQIDLQRTVDANAAQGVPFTLRPAPGTGEPDSGR